MKRKIVVGVVILTLAVLAGSALAKPGNGGSRKAAKAKKALEIKNYEKSTGSKSDAALYREKTGKATKEMKETGEKVKIKAEGQQLEEQEAVGEEIGQTADDAAETAEDTAEAIEQVESRNKFKTALIGTDYKNLGQLRSSLVHNRYEIRKITKLIAQTTDPAARAALQQQLTLLAQERERVKTIVTTQESTFSLLGWFVKLVTGYEEEPLETPEEEQLTDEVTDALTEDPNADPTTGTTTGDATSGTAGTGTDTTTGTVPSVSGQ